MVQAKNRLLSALISPQTRNSDNSKWDVVIAGVLMMIFIFAIVVLCHRLYYRFCRRTSSENSSEKSVVRSDSMTTTNTARTSECASSVP